MKRTMIGEAVAGEICLLQGFVEHIRNKRTMAFVVLRDKTGMIQLTIGKQERPELVEMVDALTVESTISVEGTIVRNEQVKLGGIEVFPHSITVESRAEPLPLLKDSGIDARLDYRWIDLRSERNQLIFGVQTLMVDAFRRFLMKRDYTELHTPKLIAAASESGSDVFELNYFGGKAYLSQSPQFYKQMAMAAGLERIYEVGPVFRAEKSHTRRHATEFTGFDLELSWIESYRDLMELEAEMLKDALLQLKERYGEAVERLFGCAIVVPETPFPVIRLADLYKELEARYGYRIDEAEMGDLTTEAEQLAGRFAMEVYHHEFLFVTDFSAENRAFYHMREENIPQGYDLLWKGVEITTGAQREHRYPLLAEQAAEKNMGEDVRFYLDFFRYGCPPHGGFGVGVDRLTMLLLDLSIKEVMFLFRGPNRLTP